MNPFADSTTVAAEHRRSRRMDEATAHRQAREASRLRSRPLRSRRRDPAPEARWQPVVACTVDLRCLPGD
jgi:hypothetical protein